jgi:hypothetical protein
VALWETYTGEKAATNDPGLHYEPRIVERAVPAAMKRGLQKAMEQDRQHINALRDTLLWEILLNSSILLPFQSDNSHMKLDEKWMSLRHTKLREIGSPRTRIKGMVATELEGTLALEMQKVIMEETDDKAISSPLSSKGDSKGKKKKKKNKIKRRAQSGSKEESSEFNREEDEEMPVEQPQGSVRIHTPIDFPENGTLAVERNRNIIIALTMLEEVIEATFLEVGLEPTPPFVEEKKPETNQRKNETITLKMKKKVPARLPAKSILSVRDSASSWSR